MAKKYAIIHQGPITVAAIPGAPAPGPAPDLAVSVGTLDQSNEPRLLPITIGAVSVVTEIHVIQFPAGQPVPNDPLAALALSYPKGSADVSSVRGATVNVPIPNMTVTADGMQDNLVVIGGYDDGL
jgi:hypothetical protein